jgi:thimet oligopeptidase
MKPNPLFLSIALALLAPAAGAAPTPTPQTNSAARPLIPLFKADQVAGHCEAGLKDLKKRVAALEKLPAAKLKKGRDVFARWDALTIASEDLQGSLDLLSNVDPDPKVRGAMEPCLVKINAFTTELYQNEKLFKVMQAAQADDIIDAKYRQDVLDAFEDTGAALPAEKRERMKALAKKIDELSQEFSRNVRDNNEKVSFTPDEMKGLPEAYLANAKRDDKGNYLLGFDYPAYNPFMDFADDSQARKRYQAAFQNRGGARNLELMKQVTQLRREIAGLFGMDNYADYVIRRRMAGTSAEVQGFLGSVQKAVTEAEKREVEVLRVTKSETLKTPLAETSIGRWDLPYWENKVKQSRYKVDQNELRKYFVTEAAVPWILDISAKLYGVQFKQVKVPVWHQDVVYYDVIDSTSKQRIAGMYLDLFPREGKYGHAAAWGVRNVSTLAKRTPISTLVTNLNRQGLDLIEMETLVHEFGHVLHGVLSNTRYTRSGGTNTELDFVEAPSQMYEEWARSKQSLASFASFCKTACPSLDDALIARMAQARNFGRAIRFGRQLVYAKFDMAIHGKEPVEPMDAWKQIEGATPMGYVDGTHFPGQFNHSMGGYGAGYYGYMWSEVLALDMLSAYKGNLMNPEIGRRYRKEILSKGAELRAGDLVKNFLGRVPDSKAFYAEISGQRVQ